MVVLNDDGIIGFCENSIFPNNFDHDLLNLKFLTRGTRVKERDKMRKKPAQDWTFAVCQ